MHLTKLTPSEEIFVDLLNKDVEHLIMLNITVFPYLCVNLKPQKDIFCAKLVFIFVLKQRSIIKQNIIIFHLQTVSKI